MNILNIIDHKRNGKSLTKEEIDFVIEGYCNDSIPDYQISSLLMAIVLKGMNDKETFLLTEAMIKSGDRVDTSKIKGITYDKHSTGGVGDKTSLVLLPLVSTFGIKFLKLSGRGLGFTGGTLDKLESIPGVSIDLREDEIVKQVNKIGFCIAGQTKNIVPADKKLYALRDVTGTVQSIPLIASSVMSKKIAGGADSILLNVTVGNGAFMTDMNEAIKLSKLMVKIGNYFNRKTSVVISSMDEPLGYAIGNNLEVKEVVESLKDNGPKDLMELVYKAGSIMLINSKLAKNENQAVKMLKENIKNGKAFNVFKDMINAQGGDISYLDDINKFEKAKYCIDIKSPKKGYILKIDTKNIGNQSALLGAGRLSLADKIDFSAGIIMKKKLTDFVEKDDVLCTIFTNKDDVKEIVKSLEKSFTIIPLKCRKGSTIRKVIN